MKPGTDFGVTVYGVNDTGLKENGQRAVVQQASGFTSTPRAAPTWATDGFFAAS